MVEGFSAPVTSTRFPLTVQAIHQALETDVAPGFAVGIWCKKEPSQFWLGAWGSRRVVPSRLPISVDTPFDLASLTKVVATSVLAATMVDRGWLRWDTPVASILTQFSAQDVEVRHLLSHTAGFVAWKPYWQALREGLTHHGLAAELEKIPVKIRQARMRELILAEVPDEKPGARVLYSDVSFLLLGFLLEEVTGRPLDRAVRDFVWEPLGLREFQYRPGHQPSEIIAATEDCPWRKRVLQGEVHDDNCWAMGGYAGHAGVFGTVNGLLKFIRSLVMDRFLSPRVLAEMWTPVAEPAGCGRTLGWDTPSEVGSSAGQYFSRRSVGHLGFSGTSLWYDADAGVTVAMISNRVHPSRENNRMKEFRPIFHNAVRTDLLQF